MGIVVTDLSITEFLTARLKEREALALAARDEAPGLTWEPERVYDGVYAIDLGPATHPDSDSYSVGEDVRLPREMAQHIAANNPARVLADIAAKRRILAEHRPVTERASWDSDVTYCRTCTYDDGLDRDVFPCRTVCLLASPFSDHPDFNPDWRVDD